MEKELIAFIWALSQTVEIDENSIIEIANLLNIDEDHVNEIISNCIEIYEDQERREDFFMDNIEKSFNFEPDDDDFFILDS